MANPYDKARELTMAIKESQEYIDYLSAKERASQNPELVAMLNDYQERQFDIQKRIMLGEDMNQNNIMQQMQDLYQVLARDPAAAAYLHAQMRFTMMVNDVYKMLTDIIKV